MEKELYSMIFKRKSFHIFRDIGNINPDELQSIEEKYNNLTPLINGIQTAIRIMPANKVAHYNRIDIGIFLCFLDLCLMENRIGFEREFFTDMGEDDCQEVLIAKYTLS